MTLCGIIWLPGFYEPHGQPFPISSDPQYITWFDFLRNEYLSFSSDSAPRLKVGNNRICGEHGWARFNFTNAYSGYAFPINVSWNNSGDPNYQVFDTYNLRIRGIVRNLALYLMPLHVLSDTEALPVWAKGTTPTHFVEDTLIPVHTCTGTTVENFDITVDFGALEGVNGAALLAVTYEATNAFLEADFLWENLAE